MGADNKKLEKPSQTPESNKDASEKGKEVPQAAKVRAEWREFLEAEDLDKLKKIEQDREDKKKTLEELTDNAADQRSKESWLGNSLEKPTVLGLDISDSVKSEISEIVDEEFTNNSDIFDDVGLSSSGNIQTLKKVAKEIIYEHFCRNGCKEETTKNYVENNLIPKLKDFFNALNGIYQADKEKHSSPLDFLEKFAGFAGLAFLKNGKVSESNIKTLLLLDKSSLRALIDGYEKYHSLASEVEELTGEASNLLGEKVDIAQLFSNGQLQLNNTLRITIPSDLSKLADFVNEKVESALPNNLSSTVKKRSLTWILEQLKAKNPQANEVFELAVNGIWSDKIETQAKEEQQVTQAEETASAAGSGSLIPENPLDMIKTGNPWIDKAIGALKGLIPAGLMAKMTGWFSNIAEKVSPEFLGLSDEEKKEGQALKAEANKLKLNEKVMKTLYKDADQMKKILLNKRKEGLSWEKYLDKYLSDEDLNLLEQEPTAETKKAADIGKMFMTE